MEWEIIESKNFDGIEYKNVHSALGVINFYITYNNNIYQLRVETNSTVHKLQEYFTNNRDGSFPSVGLISLIGKGSTLQEPVDIAEEMNSKFQLAKEELITGFWGEIAVQNARRILTTIKNINISL